MDLTSQCLFALGEMPTLPAPILAAGIFGSIGMLIWGAAAVVPLLIHLWNRRHHHEAPFAAMEFLLAAVQEQSKRLRIEQLLLLLLRVAIPCVFALALADPLWQLLPSQGSSLGSRVPHHHLFLVDTSYSMECDHDGQTRLEKGKAVIRQIVEDSPQGDGFTLVRMSKQSAPVVASPVYAKADILAEVDGLVTFDQEADLISAFKVAKQTLQEAKTNQPRLKRHRLYVLSDLGRNTWQAVEQPTARSLVGEIDELAEVVTVDVGGRSEQQTTNSGLVSATRSSVLPIRGSTMIWNVAARNWGSQSVESSIELRVNDRLVEKKSVSMPAGQSGTATFQYQFDSVGQYVASFHLPDDLLHSDNQRYEIIKVREQLSVLCVEGRPGAARNVAIALAPNNQDRIQVRTIRDHQLGDVPLSPFEAIFLCNTGNLTNQQATELSDFAKQGGSLIFFLGDQIQIQNANELLFERLSLLPGKLIERSEYGTHRFSPLDYRHPLMQVFRGQEESGLLNSPIWTYVRMERPDDSMNPPVQDDPDQTKSNLESQDLARLALEFANGDPAIVEHTYNHGSVVVITTAPSSLSMIPHGGRQTSWNAWSVWPSFPPMVQELLTFSTGELDERNNRTVGQSLNGKLPSESDREFINLRGPDEQEQRIAVEQDQAAPTWSWNHTQRSGFYAVQADTHHPKNRSIEPEKFAVNIANYRESQLDVLAVSDLPSQLQQHSIDASSSSGEARIETAPLFRQILGLLLVLLIAETALAWYFGNGRA